MQDISLHILDIAENALKAGADRIEIKIIEDRKKDVLTIQIIDNGQGMDEEMVKKVTDPFVTSRKERRVGLGLPLFAEAARMSGGEIHIHSEPGKQTTVEASFVLSSIDRKPIGDICKTIITLIAGNPDVDFKYYHKKGNHYYMLDTKVLREHLEEVPLNHPALIKLIREDIEQGLKRLRVNLY